MGTTPIGSGHSLATFRLVFSEEMVGVDALALGDIAESGFAVGVRLLAISDSHVPTLPVYMCSSIEALRGVEVAHGVTVVHERAVGGFYRKVPMIALVRDGREVETMAHEAAHWAVAQLVNECPPIIDEGIAEFIEHTIMSTRPGCAAKARAASERRWRILAYEVATKPLRSLREMFGLDKRAFFATENYALAWCLAKVLVERETQEPGRLRQLLLRFESFGPRWTSFVDVYPANEIESAWHSEVRAVAAGGYVGDSGDG